MSYEIKQYSIDQAKKHGYTIKISSNKKKKLDVYKNGIKICSLGDLRYRDYPTYIEERGLTFANVRRALYHNRHKKDIEIKDRKSTRLNSSHLTASRIPSSA